MRRRYVISAQPIADAGPRILKEPGSLPWSRQTLSYMKVLFASWNTSFEKWQSVVEEIKQRRIWETFPPEQPYGTLDALLAAEIGTDPALIAWAQEGVRLLAEHSARRDSVRKPDLDRTRYKVDL